MESLTYLKNVKMSPKKLRFLLRDIKKLGPVKAVDFLFYTPKKGARIFHTVLNSALANAKNVLKVDVNLLQFKLLTVEQGQKLKRFRAGGRGTPKPYRHEFSHIKIILTAKEEKPIPKKEEKKSVSEAKKVKAVKKDLQPKVRSAAGKK